MPASLIHVPASFVNRLEPGRIFAGPRPLELELGSGDGTFLVAWARQHPERDFLGVERLLGRLRKIDRKGRRAGLSNLRVIRIEAAYFLKYLAPLSAIHALHVYFPDPWPKRRHWKKRLINPEFLESAQRVLAPGGTVYLRTDNRAYFEQMQEVFGQSAFQAVDPPADLLAVTTDFERDFQSRGIATLSAAYRCAG